jgi:hypothetical protein
VRGPILWIVLRKGGGLAPEGAMRYPRIPDTRGGGSASVLIIPNIIKMVLLMLAGAIAMLWGSRRPPDATAVRRSGLLRANAKAFEGRGW